MPYKQHNQSRHTNKLSETKIQFRMRGLLYLGGGEVEGRPAVVVGDVHVVAQELEGEGRVD